MGLICSYNKTAKACRYPGGGEGGGKPWLMAAHWWHSGRSVWCRPADMYRTTLAYIALYRYFLLSLIL